MNNILHLLGVNTSYLNRFIFTIIILNFWLSTSRAAARYVTIERQVYRNLEYQFIMTDNINVFVMNQPYNESSLHQNGAYFIKRTPNRAEIIESEDGISVLVKPGYQLQTGSESSSNPSTLIDGYFKSGNIVGVNRLYASQQLKKDEQFHGDKGEWVSAYLYDAYVIYSASPRHSFFGGRTARNIGIPNEYSLFLSDNPYPYDHFGFSTSSDNFQFSWYFGRLNDMLGIDDEGLLIPIGETKTVRRYMSFQRLDLKVSKRLQIGLSEATLYGGPDQTTAGAYVNPLNFYYLSQRNQNLQMNGSWQVNVFYYTPHNWALYLDFYIDDFIINNDEGIDDRGVHPDRLAIMSKISIPDLGTSATLTTLRYVRVWNETYVTYRNFENWIYFSKGLGFPERSYEGLKLESSYLGSQTWEINLSIEAWRQGDRSLHTTLVDETDHTFPAGPVTNGFRTLLDMQYLYKNLVFNLELVYDKTSSNIGSSSAISTIMGINYTHNLNL
jgi:hypothetical protein